MDESVTDGKQLVFNGVFWSTGITQVNNVCGVARSSNLAMTEENIAWVKFVQFCQLYKDSADEECGCRCDM